MSTCSLNTNKPDLIIVIEDGIVVAVHPTTEELSDLTYTVIEEKKDNDFDYDYVNEVRPLGSFIT